MDGDYVDIIEAAYALETDEAPWLRGLIGAARSSLGERGDVWALVYELGESRSATIARLELGAGRSTEQEVEVERLTAAERAVVALATDGHSNAAIAGRRGTNTRAVANQLASAYRKLRLSGRRERRARFS